MWYEENVTCDIILLLYVNCTNIGEVQTLITLVVRDNLCAFYYKPGIKTMQYRLCTVCREIKCRSTSFNYVSVTLTVFVRLCRYIRLSDCVVIRKRSSAGLLLAFPVEISRCHSLNSRRLIDINIFAISTLYRDRLHRIGNMITRKLIYLKRN